MKETILITGVAGLLGSRLANWIIENKPEYKVVGMMIYLVDIQKMYIKMFIFGKWI